jgi:hypothetical protein
VDHSNKFIDNVGVQDKDLKVYVNRFSFARMLHNIWMKITTSYAQKGWGFPMSVTNRLPHLALSFANT